MVNALLQLVLVLIKRPSQASLARYLELLVNDCDADDVLQASRPYLRPVMDSNVYVINVDHECVDEYDVGELRRYIRRTFAEICRTHTV